MFLVGGPAFSGTTLLALLLNQGDLVCLDEPDFHKPEQRHRGIPVLQSLFPGAAFPSPPERRLTHQEAYDLMGECARVVSPKVLGMKTCNEDFLSFAGIFARGGCPVIAIVRDIRDALVRPLPAWVTESTLNDRYRLVWKHLDRVDMWIRYEDLVRDPATAMRAVSSALARDLTAPRSWASRDVPSAMLKLDRHDLLRSGSISSTRVGIWRASGKAFSAETHETAHMMGYAE